MMSGLTNRILKTVILLFLITASNVPVSRAADFDDYVQRLAEHPQVQLMAEGKALIMKPKARWGCPILS